MIKSEIREVTVKKRVMLGVKCDECGKEIKGKFWELTTDSGGWPDTEMSYELCSRECINKFLDAYMERCENNFEERFTLIQAQFNDKEG